MASAFLDLSQLQDTCTILNTFVKFQSFSFVQGVVVVSLSLFRSLGSCSLVVVCSASASTPSNVDIN